MATLSRSLLVRSALAFATAAALAQAQSAVATATAATTLMVAVPAASSTLPPGTNLAPQTTLEEIFSGGAGSAHARLRYQLSTTGNDVAYRVEAWGFATGAFFGGVSAYAITDGETLLQLTPSSQPVLGMLSVTSSSVGNSLAFVDIGDDGSVEWDAGGSSDSWHAMLTLSTALPIRVSTYTFSNWLGNLNTRTIDVRFRPLIHDNGPLVTHPGAGFAGADVCALQDAPPVGLATAGFPAGDLVDEFTVCDPAGWTLTSLELFAYQTGATTTSSISALNAAIYDASEVPVPNSPVFTSNLLTSYTIANEWSGVYRTSLNTIATQTDQPIMRVHVRLPNAITLPPGTYWLRYALLAAAGSPPATPPISVLGRAATGNAFTGSSVSLLDAGTGAPQGLPFRLYGTRNDPLGDFQVTSPACGTASLQVRGAPVVGGFLHADLDNPTPATAPFFGVSFGPADSIPICGCIVGHVWLVALIGPTFDFDIPIDAGLCGTDVFVQAVEFGAGGCATLPIVLTETVRAAIR